LFFPFSWTRVLKPTFVIIFVFFNVKLHYSTTVATLGAIKGIAELLLSFGEGSTAQALLVLARSEEGKEADDFFIYSLPDAP